MSGGHWNYREMFDVHGVQPNWIPKIIDAVQQCLHEIDLAESSDMSRETAETTVYDFMKSLGDELFGDSG